jgi:hypothetical protein
MPSNEYAKKKAIQKRDRLDPSAGGYVWAQEGEKGWQKLPRTMAYLFRLLQEKDLCEGKDLRGTLLDLYDRNKGEGVVELTSDREHAFAAGFDSERGVRSWQERLRLLEKAGFIKIFPRGPVQLGTVLIVHPHLAIRKLHEDSRVPEQLWEMIVERARAEGADMDKLVDAEPPRAIPIESARKRSP